ncbi:hypothetical protein V6N12_017226 [Hibiscus sabdariffa]|uniref:Protein kinase domain-containing protein n=1 Tax=Hibiscus sabdariffa TaxID=183260 RepID=A0ABR2CEU8_9ROSI
METQRIIDFPIDKRPRKKPRLTWDMPPPLPPPKVLPAIYCGQEFANGGISNFLYPDNMFYGGIPRYGSPPWRPDDKDGHYVFSIGENLTPRYRILSKMGEGTFGQVLECFDNEKQEVVAIKIIRSINKYREAAMIEIDVLQRLVRQDVGRARCVQIRNWFDYRNHICIVFERLGPSLYDFLRKNSYRSFPIDLVRELGRQILESVAFMHDLRLIHTDLKPENILLVSSECIKVPDCKDHSYVVSTRHYRAPEVILGLGWNYPCDLWSVGCILVELCSGRVFFQTHDNLEHLAMMERVLGPFPQHMMLRADHCAEKYFRRGTRLNWPDGATSRESLRAVWKLPCLPNLIMQHVDHSAGDLIDLLQGLLRYDPAKRLTAREALRHPFFKRDHRRAKNKELACLLAENEKPNEQDLWIRVGVWEEVLIRFRMWTGNPHCS